MLLFPAKAGSGRSLQSSVSCEGKRAAGASKISKSCVTYQIISGDAIKITLPQLYSAPAIQKRDKSPICSLFQRAIYLIQTLYFIIQYIPIAFTLRLIDDAVQLFPSVKRRGERNTRHPSAFQAQRTGENQPISGHDCYASRGCTGGRGQENSSHGGWRARF